MGEVYFKRFNTSQVVLAVRTCFCWIWNLREAFGFADVLAAGVGHACVLGCLESLLRLLRMMVELAKHFLECCEFAT